jgi:diacylglycerol kinase (ATP)
LPGDGRVLRLWLATINSWRGLVVAWRTEKAVQQELAALLVAIPLALFIATDAWRAVAMIGTLMVLLAVELLNTGLEKLSDHVTLETHPQIKYVKDLGSAAVAFMLLLSAMVWTLAVCERVGFI